MRPLDSEELSSLIGSIYEGPFEPVPWASALQWLTRYLHTSWAVLVLRPASRLQPSLIIEAHHQQVTVSSADYTRFERYSSDPFTDLPPDRITTPEEMLGAEHWHASEFFREYLAVHDIYYEMGADFHPEPCPQPCRLRMCRPKSRGPFSAAERHFCEMLVPHFRRAVELHARLYVADVERTLYAGGLERLGVGTVILDESGAPLTISTAARVILAQPQGIYVSATGLFARQTDNASRLRRAIEEALAASSDAPSINGLSIENPSRSECLRILIKSIPPSQRVEAQHRPAVAVFIRDGRCAVESSADVLRALFAFTTAEVHFARLLAAGLSMDEAGKRLGIRRNTCKSRLKAIFAKTGVTRQAALVGVLRDAILAM